MIRSVPRPPQSSYNLLRRNQLRQHHTIVARSNDLIGTSNRLVLEGSRFKRCKSQMKPRTGRIRKLVAMVLRQNRSTPRLPWSLMHATSAQSHVHGSLKLRRFLKAQPYRPVRSHVSPMRTLLTLMIASTWTSLATTARSVWTSTRWIKSTRSSSTA